MKRIIVVLFTILLIIVITGCIGNQETPQNSTPSENPDSTLMSDASFSVETAHPSPSGIDKLPLTDADIDKSAETITIADRNITSFDILAYCTNLKSLFINSCTIQEGIVLPAIKSLEQLGISNCGPNSIEILKNNTQITSLGLGGNQLVDVEFLRDFQNIIYLSLREDDLSDLSGLEELGNLEVLDLLDSNYGITSLKPLFGLEKLTKIYMNLKTYRNISREDLEYFGADPDATYPEGIIEVD